MTKLTDLSSSQRISNSLGFSILEATIATVVLGTLTGVTINSWGSIGNRMAAGGFANQLQTSLQSARFEAIKRNRNIAFYWDTNSQTFQTVVKSSTSSGCDIDAGDVALNPLQLPASGGLRNGITVQGTFVTQDGIVWKSNGLTGSCSNFDGSGANAIQVRFTDARGSRDFDISISSTGRVSTEFL